MKLATAAEMRELDRRAIEDYKIPSLVLMENAGRGATDLLVRDFAKQAEFGVVVLCGPGNNGGDGFVVARHLTNRGYDVTCFLVGAKSKLRGDARMNYDVAVRLGIAVFEILGDDDVSTAAAALADAGVIVDALFGTGLTRAIEGAAADLVDLCNELETPVVAIDMPSGINADTGKPTGPAMFAALTCTFGLAKIGQFVYPGALHCGRVEVVDISWPTFLPQLMDVPAHLLTEADVLPVFASRDPQAHKGSFGHVLVLGGSRGMSGAPVMTARAAVLAGAGLVTAAVPNAILPAVEAGLLEALKAGLPDDDAGRFSTAALGHATALLEDKNVIALGPGLGTSEALETFVGGLVTSAGLPLVVDADGLNNLVNVLNLVAQAPAPVVLTPHPGEMARLLKTPVAQVQDDRLAAARELAKRANAVVALKGARTVVAQPDGKVWVNPTGNAGMASGGTGDVLTGLIAGFLAQGVEPLRATLAGVYLQGLAGDKARETTGEHALTAGAMLAALPPLLREMEVKQQAFERENGA
jgi:NAD(P)H-hydrate epimerase